MATVSVEHFTDPFSPWCWAAQPTLRRLRYAFSDVEWTPRMTVLLPEAPAGPLPGDVGDGAGDDAADGGGTDGEASADEARRARWAEAAASTGMPVADDLWPGRLPSSRPACAAVAFVRQTAPERTLTVLRRLREAAFVDGRVLDAPGEVAAVAGEVDGVDERAVRRGLDDGRAAAALDEDVARAVAVAGELEAVEVRGDVSVLPAGNRLASKVTAGAGDEGAGASGPEAESEAVDAASPDEPEEPTLVGPPALRVETAGSVTVADARLPFGRLSTAFGRSVPQTGVEIDDKFATSRMAMHLPREMAESLSSQDFDAEVRPYLARFGRAYVPEVVAGTGVSRDTCLHALLSLEARGVVERLGGGEWRIVDEPGTRQRDT